MSPELGTLLEAYRATTFVIEPFGRDSGVRMEVHVGATHADLDLLLADGPKLVSQWAVITAFNPGSVPLEEATNEQRQRELEQQLISRGLAFWPARGVPPDGSWKPEESAFVLGVSRGDAVALGRKFGQVAIVFGRQGGEAELVLSIP